MEFDGETDIGEAITATEMGTKDGLSVIISDFFTDSDWKKAIDYLTYKNRQVMLLQVLTPSELDPGYSGNLSLIDAESEDVMDERNMKLKITGNLLTAYQDALGDFLEEIRSFCSSRGAEFVTVNTREPIERMLFGELLKVGIMQ